MTFDRRLLLAFSLLALAACHNDGDDDTTTTERSDRTSGSDVDRDGRTDHDHDHPAAGAGAATHRAVDSIADARCDREQTCDNIGEGHTYASRGECVSAVRADWADELTPYECPGGIDQAELDECLDQIRNEGCLNPFDSLARMIECRSGDICEAM